MLPDIKFSEYKNVPRNSITSQLSKFSHQINQFRCYQNTQRTISFKLPCVYNKVRCVHDA